MEITRLQLEKLIRERAKVLANTMFEKKKVDLKRSITKEAYRDARFNTSAGAYNSLTESELSGRRKQVFEIIKEYKGITRHEIVDLFQQIHGTEISTGSISGRLTELEQSNLIEVVGITMGKFNKKVQMYATKVV